jgi:hypothetical protein
MSLALASFKNGEGYWQAQSTSITATPQWTEVEATGRMPRENEATWKPWMKHFWLRIDCHEPKGQIFIDDLRLTEAAPSTNGPPGKPKAGTNTASSPIRSSWIGKTTTSD